MSLTPIASPQPQRPWKRKAEHLLEDDEGPAKRHFVQRWLDDTSVWPAFQIPRSRSDTFLVISRHYDYLPGSAEPQQYRLSHSFPSTPIRSATPLSMTRPKDGLDPSHTTSSHTTSFDITRAPSTTSESVAQSFGAESSRSRSTAGHKTRTRDPLYREYLGYHGIRILEWDEDPPEDVLTKSREIITRKRKSPGLSQDEVRSVQRDLATASAMDEPEFNSRFQKTGLLPEYDRETDFARDSDQLFSKNPVPHNPNMRPSVATPKPDMAFGLRSTSFEQDELCLMSHPIMRPYARPTASTIFPFLVVELKSQSRGGSEWVAENQNAGSCAHSANSLVTLYNWSHSKPKVELLKTFAFSCLVDYKRAAIYVHWCTNEGQRQYLSTVVGDYHFRQPSDVKDFRAALRNIIDFGVDTRRIEIKEALKELCLQKLDTISKSQKVRKAPDF